MDSLEMEIAKYKTKQYSLHFACSFLDYTCVVFQTNKNRSPNIKIRLADNVL